MILRRMADGIRTQNWFTVIIEIFVVVIGIFLGLQVTEWNEDRKDKARTYAYLERLSSDLDVDLSTYNDRMVFWAEVSRYGNIGLAYASTGDAEELSQWDLLLAYFQASQIAEFYSTSATFEELKSAGELGLITNTRLRDALSSYYLRGINATLLERPQYREHVRGIVPISIQTYVWTTCYDSNSVGGQTMFDCAAPVSEDVIAQIVIDIASNDALMQELRYWVSTMQVTAEIARNFVNSATSAQQLIRAELEAVQ